MPLLDALRSPLASRYNVVLENVRRGGVPPDSTIIDLDGYCEAVDRSGDDGGSSRVQAIIASTAIRASGFSLGRLSRRDAVRFAADDAWRAFDWELYKVGWLQLSGDEPDSRSFQLREQAAQDLDDLALANISSSPKGMTNRLLSLESENAALRHQLFGLVRDLGWTPQGPCGGQCDWPVCASGLIDCVHGSWRQQAVGAVLRRKHGAAARIWYVQIRFRKRDKSAPVNSMIEVGVDGREMRKLEFYRDGIVEKVGGSDARREVFPSDLLVPPLSELESRDDIFVKEISKDHFEEMWVRAAARSETSTGQW
ncbi:DUF6881 domain-containing protein [Actinoplanes rectilineatus]|uniref:DUF6881 domain-containing protein n=1 Tax=Actinoplanes rectilineatus TaxID=113571 RepID=UPI0012FA7D0B|nr:hypothetical protein [Actinoplanes rectilineatus]